MQENFVEKIVKRKLQPADYLLIVLLIIAALSLILVLLLYPFMTDAMMFIPAILLIPFIIYLLYRLISSLNKEYEYSLTNDNLTIERIVAKKRRKTIFSGSCKDFVFAAPVNGGDLDRYLENKYAYLDVRSGAFSDDDWFFITKSGGSDMMILLEADERILSAMRRYNPRVIKKEMIKVQDEGQ